MQSRREILELFYMIFNIFYLYLINYCLNPLERNYLINLNIYKSNTPLLIFFFINFTLAYLSILDFN